MFWSEIRQEVDIGLDLTTERVGLTEILLFAFPVDIAGHEKAWHTSVAWLPIIADVQRSEVSGSDGDSQSGDGKNAHFVAF